MRIDFDPKTSALIIVSTETADADPLIRLIVSEFDADGQTITSRVLDDQQPLDALAQAEAAGFVCNIASGGQWNLSRDPNAPPKAPEPVPCPFGCGNTMLPKDSGEPCDFCLREIWCTEIESRVTQLEALVKALIDGGRD